MNFLIFSSRFLIRNRVTLKRFINHQRREGTGPCHEMNLPATRNICSEIQVSKWNVFLILTDIFYVLILSPSIRNKSTLGLIFINFDFCCELIFCISLPWSPISYRLALNEFSIVNCVGSLILRNFSFNYFVEVTNTILYVIVMKIMKISRLWQVLPAKTRSYKITLEIAGLGW